ncbi:MAG: hypothetical protein ABEI98_08680 [Halorhabdus sp.]
MGTYVRLLVVVLVVVSGCQAPMAETGRTVQPSETTRPTAIATTDQLDEREESHTRAERNTAVTATEPTRTTRTASQTATGVTTDTAPTTTAAEKTNEISVEGGTLSVDVDRIFADVRAVMDADVTPPERITVIENESEFDGLLGTGGSVPRWYDLLGLKPGDGLNGTPYERMENGATFNAGFIYVLPSPDGNRSSTEWVIAHEFGHYINLRLDRVSTLRSHLGRQTDHRYVLRAIREGATVLTTDTYLTRYGNRSRLTAPLYDRLLAAVAPGEIARYGLSQYVFGYDYVANRVDDPVALDRIFKNPPTTSEQVIHGYLPGAEPPARLTVTVAESERWRLGGTDRLGEAFVRYALENGVPPERAAAAAAGWGNDRLHYLRPAGGGNSSYAWVFRWDDTTNATEFERTLHAYLDERGNRREGRWTVANVTAGIRSPTKQTTVLLMGTQRVVAKTAITAPREGAIRIDLPGDSV